MKFEGGELLLYNKLPNGFWNPVTNEIIANRKNIITIARMLPCCFFSICKMFYVTKNNFVAYRTKLAN